MTLKNRYARQTILNEIGDKGQEKISSASVLCIGAGGLGCPALLYLVAAGVGTIGIVDFDSVDETNLQRQILFSMEDIGRNKAQAAKTRLAALNPDVKINTFTEELNDQNAEKLFQDYDIIIDGTDNFSTKFLINDTAIKTEKVFIYGSILGFDGQLSVFGLDKTAPCYRCLFPEPPKGHVPNCAEAGVIGAVAGLIGTAQAMEAIKIIVAHESLKPLSGFLFTIDMHSMESRKLALSKNPNCPVCSKEKNNISLHYTSPVCSIIPELTPLQVQQHSKALLIDVREINEWDAGHIDGAQHLPLSKLMQGFHSDLSLDTDIILYCQKGIRSQQAAHILKEQGYLNIQHMAGGYANWIEEILIEEKISQ